MLCLLQVAAGGLSAPAQANRIQQVSQEAATEAAAMAEDVEAGKSNQQRGEGTGKGTKRPAEEEASVNTHPASLRLATNAKRQKTDAEWGMAARPNVCTGDFMTGC